VGRQEFFKRYLPCCGSIAILQASSWLALSCLDCTSEQDYWLFLQQTILAQRLFLARFAL
jgi:hypothetical protein